ncbi:MAG: T9SS type A sorting domain-containing protein [Brumimicrobium sp.]
MNFISKNLALSLAILLNATQLFSQVNVFDQSCNGFSGSFYNNMFSDYEANCFEFPQGSGTQVYEGDFGKTMKAGSYIEMEDEMLILPPQNAGYNEYTIENPAFDVVSYTNDLSAVPRLEKLELGITLPEFIQEGVENFIEDQGNLKINPFMSSQLKVEAVFEWDNPLPLGPSVITKKRDGFYYEEFDRDVSGFDDLYTHPLADNDNIVPSSEYQHLGGGWTKETTDYPFRVRFAPPRIGSWRCTIKIIFPPGNTQYVSPEFTFNVVDSNKKGYLKVDDNDRFLKRDDKTYRPIGLNYPWPNAGGFPLISDNGTGNRLVYEPQYHKKTPSIAHYEQYLRNMDTLAMNGVNYFRLIMCPWSLNIEYEKLGDYSDRMHIAKEMDLIVERAEQNDMLIHWDLMIHYTLQTNTYNITAWDWSFDGNPSDSLSTSTEGYCYHDELNLNSPIEFFENTHAKKYYRERLRYIVSRWGYSPDIAMFEHFSEIDQVGKVHDENGNTVSGTNLYSSNANKEKIFFWHGEMSNYLKDELEIPQLLTLSYTTDLIVEDDLSFWHGNIDVINWNNYNYHTSDVHGYHRQNIKTYIAERGEDYDDGEIVWGNYQKPLFFSEMGATNLWDCDNGIETRRSIWQSYFWGISGGLEWEKPEDLSIYQRVSNFISDVDLKGEWHSGMMTLDNNDRWKYKKSYRDDCIREDELADVVYLRSGDQKKAFGVITNRRANYYTLGEGECTGNTTIGAPLHSNHDNDPSTLPDLTDYTVYSDLLQEYGSVEPKGGSNRLRIRNMKLSKEYKIKYYSPYDLVNSIKEETRWGPKLTLEFPDLDTLDIVLFEVFRMGGSFKSMQNDSINSDNNDKLSRELKVDITENIKVFPNPNDGSFVVLVENPSDAKAIYITDNLGKRIDSKFDVSKENLYNKTNFRPGVYFIEAVFEDKVIQRKIIIN